MDLAVVQILSISFINFFDILSEKYLDFDLHLIYTSIIFLLENDWSDWMIGLEFDL